MLWERPPTGNYPSDFTATTWGQTAMLAHGNDSLGSVVHREQQMKAFTAALWASSVPSPVTCATQRKAKTIPSLAPWNTMLDFTVHPALFLELLSLLDLLCPMTSFAFQMNSVHSAMQWSPDAAKCFGPCLIWSPQIALLVLSVCRGCQKHTNVLKEQRRKESMYWQI